MRAFKYEMEQKNKPIKREPEIESVYVNERERHNKICICTTNFCFGTVAYARKVIVRAFLDASFFGRV